MSTVPVIQCVAHAGADPRQSWNSGGNTIGMVHHFAGDYAPGGLWPLDGRSVPAESKVLHELYGGKPLPDLQGRVMTGAGWRVAPGEAGHDGRSLTLHWIIAIGGLFPSGGVAPAMGQIRAFLGSEAPNGWQFCRGQILNGMQHQAMYALLENVYGGSYAGHIGLPDLTGRVPVGIKPGEVALGQKVQIDGVPGLGVNMLIVTEGELIGPSGYGGFEDDHQMLGDILIQASDKPWVTREGVLPADGRLLEIAKYRHLFDAIGTRFGGDGVTTFALPDLRGRMLTGCTPRVLSGA